MLQRRKLRLSLHWEAKVTQIEAVAYKPIIYIFFYNSILCFKSPSFLVRSQSMRKQTNIYLVI